MVKYVLKIQAAVQSCHYLLMCFNTDLEGLSPGMEVINFTYSSQFLASLLKLLTRAPLSARCGDVGACAVDINPSGV